MKIIKWYLSDVHAPGHIRGEVLARELNASYPNYLMDCKSTIGISDFSKTNIMVFQRAVHPQIHMKMQLAKNKGIRTVYDLDDDLFNVPKEFKDAHDFFSREDVQGVMTAFLNECDAVTCSTEPLAEAMDKRIKNGKVYVVKNAIDCDYWNESYMQKIRTPREGVTIGWMASSSHVGDAPLVKNALMRIMKENPCVKLHLIGWVGADELGLQEFKDRITCEGWIDINALPAAMSDFDISLCPVLTIPFNDAKSNIKVLQAGVLGAVSVCSPAHPYLTTIDHGYDGLIVEGNTEQNWYRTLDYAVKEDKFRLEAGQRIRDKVYGEWNIKDRARHWVNVFESILSK